MLAHTDYVAGGVFTHRRSDDDVSRWHYARFDQTRHVVDSFDRTMPPFDGHPLSDKGHVGCEVGGAEDPQTKTSCIGPALAAGLPALQSRFSSALRSSR